MQKGICVWVGQRALGPWVSLVYIVSIYVHTTTPSSMDPVVLFGLGDVFAQTFTKEKDKGYDLPRLGRAWVFGTFILGPLAHWHFNFLEHLVVKRVRGVGGCGLFFLPFIFASFPDSTLQLLYDNI